MASSFYDQIPAILDIIRQLKPGAILDIGKGFGKYGFLVHEYIGIAADRKVDRTKTMAGQSAISIDAVEVDPDLMMPHLEQVYRKVYFGDVFDIYKNLDADYDLVLMVDVIEHLPKDKSIALLRHFLAQGSTILVATPKKYFQQHLYESRFEEHISHWTVNDFRANLPGFVDSQCVVSGMLYLVSMEKKNLTGFGSSLIKKLKRVYRSIASEV